LCWPADVKKVGVEQGKVGHVGLADACLAPSDPFANGTLRHFSPRACFFTSGRSFLTRVGHVRVWAPFNVKRAFLGPLRTRAGSMVHCAAQEPVWCAVLCKGNRGGCRRGGEKEGRGNGGRGEGSRSGWWW
jgi:hypothetical protein